MGHIVIDIFLSLLRFLSPLVIQEFMVAFMSITFSILFQRFKRAITAEPSIEKIEHVLLEVVFDLQLGPEFLLPSKFFF